MKHLVFLMNFVFQTVLKIFIYHGSNNLIVLRVTMALESRFWVKGTERV